MQALYPRPDEHAAVRTDLKAIFVSLELSRSTWVITSLAPGGGEKMSKRAVPSGDIPALLARLSQLTQKARARTGHVFPILVIQEAGLDGVWIHRVLQREGIESQVVDPASIATSRRRRRAKTDTIDGEALVRALLAYKRGEPRVCAMVQAPTPHEEDRRRIGRERETLTAERVRHVNRIKGLLFAQGIGDYEPLHRNRRERLKELITGDGRPLPECLKAQIRRELDRLELLIEQVKAVEAERDAVLAQAQASPGVPAPAALLLTLRGIGPEAAATLWSEGLFRTFNNRKQVAAYAGLAPTPWQISRELDRLELLIEQVKAVEAERDAVLAQAQASPGVPAPAALLLALRGIGPEAATTLWSEGLFRTFNNRKQVAAYAGLAPTPWQSGSVHRDQ